MPIRPENKARYPAGWPKISRDIREAAGQKCEWCKAPNGVLIYRFKDGSAYMVPTGETFDAKDGTYLGMTRGSEMPGGHFTKVVLTVAHLDHQPENCDRDNLKALCQKCHNTYDAPTRRKGVVARKPLPLFDRDAQP